MSFKRWAALGILPIAVLVSGCGDNSFSISNDVRLMQLHGSTWALTDADGAMLVGPKVTAITCGEDFAWGQRDGSSYFLLNLRSNEIERGMSKRQLESKLSEIGVSFAEPHKVSSIERSFSGCG